MYPSTLRIVNSIQKKTSFHIDTSKLSTFHRAIEDISIFTVQFQKPRTSIARQSFCPLPPNTHYLKSRVNRLNLNSTQAATASIWEMYLHGALEH